MPRDSVTSAGQKMNHFVCNICEEESQRICLQCTKDACENHLCEKCARCSDCCTCESSRVLKNSCFHL